MSEMRQRDEPIRTLSVAEQFRVNFSTAAALISALREKIQMNGNGPSSDFINKSVDICNAFIVDQNKASALSKLSAARDAIKAGIDTATHADLDRIYAFIAQEIERQPEQTAEAKTK